MSPVASDVSPSTFDPRTLVLTQFILLLGVVLSAPDHFIALLSFTLVIAGIATAFQTQTAVFLAKWKRALPIALLIVVPVLLVRALFADDPGAWIVTAGLFVKVLLALSTVIVLLAVLPFHEILFALRRLRVPALFLDILAMAYRYLDVLNAERVQLVRSLAARGHTAHWIWQSRIPGKLAGSLFLRSVERAERIHMAMLARGYEGSMNGSDGSANGSRFTTRDMATLVTTAVVTLLILWGGR